MPIGAVGATKRGGFGRLFYLVPGSIINEALVTPDLKNISALIDKPA